MVRLQERTTDLRGPPPADRTLRNRADQQLEGRKMWGFLPFVNHGKRDRDLPVDRRQLSLQRIRGARRTQDRRRLLRRRQVRGGAVVLPRLSDLHPQTRRSPVHHLAVGTLPREAQEGAEPRPDGRARGGDLPRPTAAQLPVLRLRDRRARSCGGACASSSRTTSFGSATSTANGRSTNPRPNATGCC